MRLYHVSEESNIEIFHPRPPTRADLAPSARFVWAIAEACLPNYLTPRDCPRVAYHIATDTTPADRAHFFSSAACRHVVAIEHAWFERLCHTSLYAYALDPSRFVLQDADAGYYVSEQAQTPIACERIDNLPAALFARGVELRVLDTLWDLADAVQSTTLHWSLIRMRNAQPRKTGCF